MLAIASHWTLIVIIIVGVVGVYVYRATVVVPVDTSKRLLDR